jgi:putative transposase
MDFVMDVLATGRRVKCLTCVDDFTKECLTIITAFGITGVQVTRILGSIALFRGYPATIRTDQGRSLLAAHWISGPLNMVLSYG